MINLGSITLAQKLTDAETIGDIYRIPFPIAAASFSNTTCFSSFYDPTVDDGLTNVYREEDFDKSRLKVFGELKEVLCEHRSFIKIEHSTEWFPYYSGFMSGVTSHGKAFHYDDFEKPRTLVYFTSSNKEESTRVTSHEATYEILRKSSFSRMLELKIDDSNDRIEWQSFLSILRRGYPAREEDQVYVPAALKLRDEFIEAAEPVVNNFADNTIFLMSGITGHLQSPHISQDRVFFRCTSVLSSHSPLLTLLVKTRAQPSSQMVQL